MKRTAPRALSRQQPHLVYLFIFLRLYVGPEPVGTEWEMAAAGPCMRTFGPQLVMLMPLDVGASPIKWVISGDPLEG